MCETTASPDPEALQPAVIDQPAGRAAGRVREHRARVLAARLVLAPPAHDLVDAEPASLRCPSGLERGRDDDRARPQCRMPVAEAELVARDLLYQAVVEIDDTRAADRVRGLGAVTAGVHAHGAADTARDADEESERTHAGRRGLAGEHRQRDRGPGSDLRRIAIDRKVFEVAAEGQRDTVEAAVGDQQVRATSDHQHFDVGRGSERAREDGEVGLVLDVPRGRAGRRSGTS